MIKKRRRSFYRLNREPRLKRLQVEAAKASSHCLEKLEPQLCTVASVTDDRVDGGVDRREPS